MHLAERFNLFLTAAVFGSGCGTTSAGHPAQPERPSAATSATTRSTAKRVPCEGPDETDSTPLREADVISPGRPIPRFHVATTECEQLDSQSFVGKRPFVLVFFSSWCGVCERKLPMVQTATEELGDGIPFYGVVLDNADTWSDVEPYIARLGLEIPLVRGARFRKFSLGYNPYQSVPVVVVVGRNGYVIDLQIGYSPFDYNRLIAAGELAKRISGDYQPQAIHERAATVEAQPQTSASGPEQPPTRMPESAAE